MKKILLKVLILYSLIFNVNADVLDEIKKRNKIIIGVDIAQAPYGFIDKEAKMTGYDVDTAYLIAKELAVELEIIPVSGPNRIPYLLSNKVDIVIADFAITEEREKLIDFAIPYCVGPDSVFGPKDDVIKTLADLEGKEIAVTRAVVSDIELSKAQKQFKGIKLVRYEDGATTRQAVINGRQKYISTDYGLIIELKKNNPNLDLDYKLTLKDVPLGVALRKKNPEFKKRLDEIIVKNIKNGFLPNKYKEYFGIEIPKSIIPN